MASRASIFFAGVMTVVLALGVGFAAALMLVSTKPVEKIGPDAFAKRDLVAPVVVRDSVPEPVSDPAPVIPTTPAPEPQDAAIVPTAPTTAEGVAGLTYAPPKLAAPAAQPPVTVQPAAAPAAVPEPARSTNSSAAKQDFTPKHERRKSVERSATTPAAVVESDAADEPASDERPAPPAGQEARPDRKGF